MIFAIAFDDAYKPMGKSIINAINYYHENPRILLFTTSYNNLKSYKNIEVINFRKYKEFKYLEWHPLIWAKIYAFSLDIQDVIVFLDVDCIMFRDVKELVHKYLDSGKAIGASQDDDSFSSQFKKNIFSSYNKFKAFNAGALIFKPDKEIYKDLILLTKKYNEITKFPEQAILNLWCAYNNEWQDLESSFMCLPFDSEVLNIEKSFVLHFFTPRPDFMGNIKRQDEKTLGEKIRIFETINKEKYPLKKIKEQYMKQKMGNY